LHGWAAETEQQNSAKVVVGRAAGASNAMSHDRFHTNTVGCNGTNVIQGVQQTGLIDQDLLLPV
jgi:hypothetical protein